MVINSGQCLPSFVLLFCRLHKNVAKAEIQIDLTVILKCYIFHVNSLAKYGDEWSTTVVRRPHAYIAYERHLGWLG